MATVNSTVCLLSILDKSGCVWSRLGWRGWLAALQQIAHKIATVALSRADGIARCVLNAWCKADRGEKLAAVGEKATVAPKIQYRSGMDSTQRLDCDLG